MPLRFRTYRLSFSEFHSLLSPFSGAPFSHSYAHPSNSLNVPSIPCSREHPDAPRLVSGRHPYSDIEVLWTSLLVLATVGLPPFPRVVTSHSTTEPQHLTFSTATLVNTGTAVLQTQARRGPYLAMTRPSSVRDFCNAAVWDERRRSDTGSHVGPMFQTAAGGLSHLAP